MFCIGCGKHIEEDLKFCPYCGADLRETQDLKSQYGPGPQKAPGPYMETPGDGVNAVGYLYKNKGEAESRRIANNKMGDRMVMIAVIIAAACVLVFLLIIGPKLLGVQFLPMDPFGITEDAGVVVSSDENSDIDGNGVDDIAKEDTEIKSISISGDVIGTVEISSAGSSAPAKAYDIEVGDRVSLKAEIQPLAAEDRAETEWEISDGKYGYFDTKKMLSSVFVATESGRVEVTFTAYTDLKYQKDSMAMSIVFNIVAPEPEDTMWPFKGDRFVTVEPKSGIFIRSEPYVNGKSNMINDGNKIGWIAGGDTSVVLIATGEEYFEGPGKFWWYEVEIPQWYRDTNKQTTYFAGLPLIGWVREDVVMYIG